MEEMIISRNDELVMRLLHYFITEEGYSPIILHGAQNEIWLENLDSDCKIIRIVSNYIHNDEQLNFDLFKTKQIIRRIKRKTFSFKMDALSIFLNLGENVHLNDFKNLIDHVSVVEIENMEDLENCDEVKEKFPKILEDTDFKEKGLELFVKITEDLNKKNQEDSAKIESVFKMKKPFVTYTLIAINVLVFFLELLYGIQETAYYGANIAEYIRAGEFYRLITSAFMHAGIIHLMCNMYCLYIIGPQLESFFGKIKFLIIYLVSAIAGNLMSMLFTTGASVGASGAIFGLFGTMLYFGYHYRVYLGNVMKSQLLPLIIMNLLLGFMISGIDNAAHIGGLIGGTLITIALGVKYHSTTFEKINGWIVTIIFISFLSYLAFIGI
ncbi:MAG: rhomboid family intramembrane serine protease [Bacilli bacterium]|jgi:rhomboid protease GluP|nr:rhomboid family intramembrane serine protease [Bacilli bacterium]